MEPVHYKKYQLMKEKKLDNCFETCRNDRDSDNQTNWAVKVKGFCLHLYLKALRTVLHSPFEKYM